MSDSFATPWTVVCQGPVSMGFPRQEYWSGSLLSRSVLSDSWQPYGLQLAEFPALHHLQNLHKLLSIKSVMVRASLRVWLGLRKGMC